MTPAMQKFVELEKRKEDVKKFFDELQLATEELVKEIGINSFFQDNDGTVYKTVIPDGKFVHFEKVSYVRTKRPTEQRGTLSVKEAKEHGFNIE